MRLIITIGDETPRVYHWSKKATLRVWEEGSYTWIQGNGHKLIVRTAVLTSVEVVDGD